MAQNLTETWGGQHRRPQIGFSTGDDGETCSSHCLATTAAAGTVHYMRGTVVEPSIIVWPRRARAAHHFSIRRDPNLFDRRVAAGPVVRLGSQRTSACKRWSMTDVNPFGCPITSCPCNAIVSVETNQRSTLGPGHQAVTGLTPEKTVQHRQGQSSTANAPTLKIGPVPLKVEREMAIPLASSTPRFSLQLTAAITAIVAKVV